MGLKIMIRLKKGFRPTKWKIIISIVIGILFVSYAIWRTNIFVCYTLLPCGEKICSSQFPNILKGCCDSCADFNEFIRELFIIIIIFSIVFLISYVFYSLIVWIFNKVKKK